jgi:hypothetical protein
MLVHRVTHGHVSFGADQGFIHFRHRMPPAPVVHPPTVALIIIGISLSYSALSIIPPNAQVNSVSL